MNALILLVLLALSVVRSSCTEKICEAVEIDQIWTALLSLYQRQVDPAANGIPWLDTEVLNFPSDISKKSISEWTQEDYKAIEDSLDKIYFRSISGIRSFEDMYVSKNGHGNLFPKRREVYKALMRIYQQQIDPFASQIAWKNIIILNCPINLKEKRYYDSWSIQDVAKLEESLLEIEFRKLDNPYKVFPDQPSITYKPKVAILYRALLELYQEQIDSNATRISWQRMTIKNAPLSLLTKRSRKWNSADIEDIAASLPYLKFEPVSTSLASKLETSESEIVETNTSDSEDILSISETESFKFLENSNLSCRYPDEYLAIQVLSYHFAREHQLAPLTDLETSALKKLVDLKNSTGRFSESNPLESKLVKRKRLE